MAATPPLTPQDDPQYDGLCFSFAEMEQEIENMRLLANHFLERDSVEWIIRSWQQELLNFRGRAPGSKMRWAIAETNPIKTKISDGEYEPGDRKGKKVFGCVSCAWDIQIPSTSTKKKGGAQKLFVLHGLASTEVSIWTNPDGELQPQRIAHWTIEVGDVISPGCHFHTQVKLGNSDRKPLSVPRLPTLLHTPMDALEFLLGELFQEGWYRHTSQGTQPLQHWAHCQKHRLTRLLEWQLQEFRKAGGSPWTTFKKQKPNRALFFGEIAG